jgi:hypothetical protein
VRDFEKTTGSTQACTLIKVRGEITAEQADESAVNVVELNLELWSSG